MTRDEALAWFRGLSKEIRSQDNRATASPYYYDLRYSDKDGAEKHVPHHGTIFLTEKAAKEYIVANSHNLPEGVYDYLCWGGRNPELTTLLECIDVLAGKKNEVLDRRAVRNEQKSWTKQQRTKEDEESV